MSTVLALSESFILAHIFSFPKSWTDGVLAVIFEVPWAVVQKNLLYSQTLTWSGCLPGKMFGKLLPWINLESSSMLSTAARA